MKNRVLILVGIIVMFFVLMIMCIVFEHAKEYKTDDAVTMVIKEGTLTNTGATVIITDLSDDENSYGAYFWIERKIDGKWKKVKYLHSDLGSTMPSFSVNEDHTLELHCNWDYEYGALENGEYRLIKDYFPKLNRPITENDKKYVIVEFTIEQEKLWDIIF